MWDSLITPDVMFFFDGHAGALPLYGALAERLLSEYPATKIQVRKTQIGFHDGRLYCCASLTPVRRRAERPEPFLTVTFSLDAPEPSPRLICVPVRPNRFTHHAIIGSASDIDDELLTWLRASHDLGRR
jgi:hypothetical protein